MKNLKSINTRLVSENTPAGQKFSVFTNLPSEISSEEISASQTINNFSKKDIQESK